MEKEDMESLVMGFTAAKPPQDRIEYENGNAKALRVIGLLISVERSTLKERISKLETEVSFLVNGIAEGQVIMSEFLGFHKDINGCLYVTAQLSVAEQGNNTALVEEHLAVLDRFLRAT